MPKSIMLLVRKRERVPTKRQVVHLWRTRWVNVMKLSYYDVSQMFIKLGGNLVETDAQFAKLLYDNLGEGTYSVIAWKKGREGFWSFWKGRLKPEGFQRLKKTKSSEELKVKAAKKDMNRLNFLKKQTLDQERLDNLSDQIDDIKEQIEVDNIIIEGNPRDPPISKYLIQTKPVYSRHSYQKLGVNNNIEEESNTEHDIFKTWA